MSDRIIRVEISSRHLRLAGRIGLLCGLFGIAVSELASERVMLTTYYPAPSGVYSQMITTGNTYLARDVGRVGVHTRLPIATLDVNGTIHASRDVCTDAGGGKCLSSLTLKTETYSTNYASVIGRTFTCPVPGHVVTFCYTFEAPSGSSVCGTVIQGNTCWLGGCTAPRPKPSPARSSARVSEAQSLTLPEGN